VAAKRVLIIDEDIEVRRSLRAGLMQFGWQVEEATDGLTSIEQIRRANAEGAGFCCLITEAFLTDLDGKLMLKAFRTEYPQLPIIALTGFGDVERRQQIENLQPAAYLEKPLAMEMLLAELGKFSFKTTTEQVAPTPDSAARQPEAYVFLRLQDNERAGEILRELRAMDGVRVGNAVRGEYDIVLRLAADTADKLSTTAEMVKQTAGANVLAVERLEKPRLTPEVEDFVKHYESVSADDRAAYRSGNETNAYLMIDIDRYQLERIYTSIIMTEGVISCQVSSGGAKLTVLMSGAVRPNVLRHVLQKLATMDGIRRVREATVINIAG
jgi:DNA-binding response OmpR family regulator